MGCWCAAGDTLAIDQVGARMRQAVAKMDAERSDRLATFVGQEWEADSGWLGEFTQHVNGVVTDTHNLSARGLDRSDVLLQLDQLLPAERSPIGRAIEDQGYIALRDEFIE